MTPEATRANGRQLFRDFLRFIEEQRFREWTELFAPDGVLEFMHPTPGAPARFAGHDALYEHMRQFPEVLDLRFSEPTFHDTVDPDVIVAEFVGVGTAVPTGLPVHQVFISVVHTRDGRITYFKDYWNPLTVLTALATAH